METHLHTSMNKSCLPMRETGLTVPAYTLDAVSNARDILADTSGI